MGKVLKYKPAANTVASNAAGASGASKKEETKASGPASTTSQAKELIYDMESGEMLTPEENARRKKEREKK